MTMPFPHFTSSAVTTSSSTLAGLRGLTPLAATTLCPDPQHVYQQLRDRWGPVAPVELAPGQAGGQGINAWLVMGYAEIVQMVRQERLFTRDPRRWRDYAAGRLPADSPLGPMMFPRDNAYFADGPEHRRLRAPLVEGLEKISTQQLHRMRRSVQALCTDLIGGFAHQGSADLVGDYAAHIPMLAVTTMFGLPKDESQALLRALAALFGSGEDAQEGNRTLEAILTRVMNARRAHPTDDLTTLFVHHRNLRSDYEIQQSMVLMVTAGSEPTITWITAALRLMLTDARFAGQLRGGRLDVDAALDEVLWADAPMANMPARFTLADTWLGGQHIQAGDALILGLAAANHDPQARSGDPRLDVGNRAHLAWSTGPHGCPASRTARLVARIAVDTALRLLPGMTLTVPAQEIVLQPSPWMRRPQNLPVTFTATMPRSR